MSVASSDLTQELPYAAGVALKEKKKKKKKKEAHCQNPQQSDKSSSYSEREFPVERAI